MDILWPALGICVIVCFVFYVLAQHWRRVLREQSWMVRRLATRVRELEELTDPQFRQRLNESSPMPLEQVITFSFRLSDRFWRGTLGLTDTEWEFVRTSGSFVGSVKLERWRSHTVATIVEALPSSHAAEWQKRSLDFYPGDGGDKALVLWELRLGLPGGAGERPSSLELVLGRETIELLGRLRGPASREANGNGARGESEAKLFSVSLDTAQLAEFRRRDPVEEGDEKNSNPGRNGWRVAADSWRALYAATNEQAGFEWQLCVRDLTRKANWERWKILDPVELGRM
jgi:hypothetical protein